MTSTWVQVLKLTFLGQPIVHSTRLNERKTIPVNLKLYKDDVKSSLWKSARKTSNFIMHLVFNIASFPDLSEGQMVDLRSE